MFALMELTKAQIEDVIHLAFEAYFSEDLDVALAKLNALAAVFNLNAEQSQQRIKDVISYTTRLDAQKHQCPTCGAEPTKMCTVTQVVPRRASHRERHLVALSLGAPRRTYNANAVLD